MVRNAIGEIEMSKDLEQTAADIVAELVYYHGTLNELELVYDHGTLNELSSLRDAVSDMAHDRADSAVTFTHLAQEIINDYENHPAADCYSADDMGSTFKPSQYREAMTAYAYGIARSVIEAEAYEAIDAIEEAADEMREELAKLEVWPDASHIRVTADCIHGWASHDRETDTGVCLWISGQLDGCNAVAIKSGPVWLTYTWEPNLLGDDVYPEFAEGNAA
jgi:hypothetical protein